MSDVVHLELNTRSTATSQFRDVLLKREGVAEPTRLWYEIVGGASEGDLQALDGIVFAVLLHAMRLGARLVVHGPLSRSALYNMEDWQAFWHLWRPDTYKRIEIVPEKIVDLERRKLGRRAIAAFSGGVDSTFTTLRHTLKLLGAGSYNLDSVLMVHGFDVSLANSDHLDQLIRRTQPFLAQLGVDLKIVRTNSKELRLMDWEDTFSAQLAGCLHHFSSRFEFGLVGSSEPYNDLYLPWGSNPITDGLLSGDGFAIVHDGAGFSRTDKIATLVRHPASVAGLKVCWEGSDQHRNCGVCEKCMRTRLNFLAVGEPDPVCFDDGIELARITSIPIRNRAAFVELRSIATYAQQRHIDAEWVHRLDARLRAYERAFRVEKRRERIGEALAAMGMKKAVKRGLRCLKLLD